MNLQGLVSKKKMFYQMKVKHEQEVTERKCHAHQLEVNKLKEGVSARLKNLHITLARVCRISLSLSLSLSNEVSTSFVLSHQLKQTHTEEEEEEEKKEKCRLIQERTSNLTSYMDHIHTTSSEYLSQMRADLAWKVSLLQAELASGGNVKFSPPDGGHGGHWHRACTELVKSRFSVANWQVGVAPELGGIPCY